MSLLTVMAGAAIAPALGVTGLVMYVVLGAGAFFAKDIWTLMVLRALLGVSVGMIMPLSTGLLSYYFPPEEQAGLMGLSAAMNQMGGVVATLLSGLLANLRWNYAFLVYLLGLVAVVFVILFLPNERLASKGARIKFSNLVRFHPSVTGMLLLMIIFFVYPTNFAIAASAESPVSGNAVTVIMVSLDLVAFFVGLVFGRMMVPFRKAMKYFAPVLFMAGYLVLSFYGSVPALLAGSWLIGLANGVGVPYLNTIASIKGGKESATTVMPLLSAALYLGQFVSPLIVLPAGKLLFGESDLQAPFKVAVIFCAIFLIQVFSTRHFQSLPPAGKRG